jgi:hypothetical protein
MAGEYAESLMGTGSGQVGITTPTTRTSTTNSAAAARALAVKKAAEAAAKKAAEAAAKKAADAAAKKKKEEEAKKKKEEEIAAEKKKKEEEAAKSKETPAQIAKRIAAEEKAAEQAAFYADAGAVFRGTLKTVFPGSQNDTWINQLFEAAKPRLTVGFDTNEILDLMIQNGETPNAFNQRFKGIFELDKRRDAGEKVYVPKISEYVAGEEEYARLMTRMGMSTLGTTENYGTLVGNDLSLDEVRDRITDAYTRVKSLDDQVLAGLKEQFPSLKQGDLVQAVLTKETPNELQNRITRAEIGVEAKQAGVVSMLGAQALQEKGITRSQARAGFQSLAEYQRTSGAGIAQAQQMFGDKTSAADLQTELESEALLGQTSKTRKRLESQARAQFGGQSGIATGSLSRKRQL